jgi:fatty acid desaturase
VTAGAGPPTITAMKLSRYGLDARQLLMQAAYVVVACAAGALSYRFGSRLGGPGLGITLAINAAIFGCLMVGAVADALLRWRQRR